MKAALNLKFFGARIIDLQKEIENIHNVLNDVNSTNRTKKASSSTVPVPYNKKFDIFPHTAKNTWKNKFYVHVR